MLVTKNMTFEMKAAEDGKRETIGVLSTNELDRQNDRVDQKSLGESLGRFVKKNGIVVWNHDWEDGGIGRVVDYSTDGDKKTLVRIRYGTGYKLKSGMSVDDVWKQIEQGIVRTHSHAFSCDRTEIPGSSGEYKCSVRDVFEVSVVIVPANSSATFEAIKRYVMKHGSAAEYGQSIEIPDARPESEHGEPSWAEVFAKIHEARRAIRDR